MNHIAVVYWSGTGNTEQMAQAVLEGAKESGASSECFSADEFDGTMIIMTELLLDALPWVRKNWKRANFSLCLNPAG